MTPQFAFLGPNKQIVANAVFARALGELDHLVYEIPQGMLHTSLSNCILRQIQAGKRDIGQITRQCVWEVRMRFSSAPEPPSTCAVTPGKCRQVAIDEQPNQT